MKAGGDSSEDDKSAVDAHRGDDRIRKTLLEVDASGLLDRESEFLTSDRQSRSESQGSSAGMEPVVPGNLSDSGRIKRTLLESNIPSLNQINESLCAELPQDKANDRQSPHSNNLSEPPRRVAKTLQDSPNQSVSHLKSMDAARQSASNLKPVQDAARQSTQRRERGGVDFAKPNLEALQAAAKKAEAAKESSVAPETLPPRSMSKQNIKLVKARKISNTMVDIGYQMQSMEPLNDKRLEYVPKTMLDHNMLFKAVSTSALREEAKFAAIIEERAKLPPKEKPAPIKADKPSSPCPFRWDATESDEKYKICSKCQLPVYNLADMDKNEAAALIFKREAKSKFTLFGREDGKFTTSDCPVKAQNQKNLATAVVVAVALVAGAVAVLMLLPQQSPKPQSESPNTVQQNQWVTPSARKRTKPPVSTTDGNRLQTFRFPDAAQKSGGTDASGKPHVYDPDEDGSFWKFDNSP